MFQDNDSQTPITYTGNPEEDMAATRAAMQASLDALASMPPNDSGYFPRLELPKPVDLARAFYVFAENQIYSVEQGCLVAETPPEATVIEVPEYSSKDLRDTLKLYSLPIGDCLKEPQTVLLEKLAALDRQYLTQRVLAGLAVNDAYALGQWQQHEAEAAPLRQRLAELAGQDLPTN